MLGQVEAGVLEAVVVLPGPPVGVAGRPRSASAAREPRPRARGPSRGRDGSPCRSGRRPGPGRRTSAIWSTGSVPESRSAVTAFIWSSSPMRQELDQRLVGDPVRVHPVQRGHGVGQRPDHPQRVAVGHDHPGIGVGGEDQGKRRQVRRRLHHPPLAWAWPTAASGACGGATRRSGVWSTPLFQIV